MNWDSLAQVVEDASAVVIVTDAEGVVRIVNAAGRVLVGGLVGERLSGATSLDERGLAALRKLAEEVARGEGGKVVEESAPDAGARGSRPVAWRATALCGEEGEARGTIYWGQDLTAAREAQEQLATRREEIAELASVISHDLRAPLISIDGFAQSLKRQYGDALDKRGQRYIKRIREGAKRLNGLIDSVLDLARVDVRSVRPSPVALKKILQKVMTDFMEPIRQSGTRIMVARNLPTISGDAVRLYQIFANLISNALKYMGEQAKPVIEITWRELGGEIEVRVGDNGMGIAADEIGGIFEMFKRAGVGLAVVKRIVEDLGGGISVESQPGKGTTFIVTLPTGEEEEEDAVEAGSGAGERGAG